MSSELSVEDVRQMEWRQNLHRLLKILSELCVEADRKSYTRRKRT